MVLEVDAPLDATIDRQILAILLEAIKAEVIGPSVDEFYVLARTALVKSVARSAWRK